MEKQTIYIEVNLWKKEIKLLRNFINRELVNKSICPSDLDPSELSIAYKFESIGLLYKEQSKFYVSKLGKLTIERSRHVR